MRGCARGPFATARAIGLRYGRKLATGSDLAHTDRALSASEAATLIKQIAADPSVAHVAPAYLLKAADGITPYAATLYIAAEQIAQQASRGHDDPPNRSARPSDSPLCSPRVQSPRECPHA